MTRTVKSWALSLTLGCAFALAACGGSQVSTSPAVSASTIPVTASPSPELTSGFDGQKAYGHVSDLVGIGPRSAGTEGGRRARQYIVGKLQSFGCQVDEQNFKAETPIGTMEMTNIIAKIPGSKPDILLLTTHFDTKRLANFVGADDGGSSTGIMLEVARVLCGRKTGLTTWIVFFDGEEAVLEWTDTDSTYGSRELAARLALSGELSRVRAMILADMVGSHNLRIRRELNSTPWLTDLIWSTAARLGYGSIFVREGTSIEDDHLPFLHRRIPAADIINFEIPYWHTPEDTLDKISPKSLAVVGHVLIETLPALEQRFGAR
jgi:glutaminyl-peptide cyclotransferase